MTSLTGFAKELRSAIDLAVTTPKRDAVRPSGVESIFKYYAGFSPSFARAVLQSARLDPASTVLDPWNGSGTTTHAAAALGVHATGVDINPVANVVASAKLANGADLSHSAGLADQIIANARRRAPSRDRIGTHPILRWLHPSDSAAFLALYDSILALLARPYAGDATSPLERPPPPLASFFIICLLRAARAHAAVIPSTNPTWLRPPKRRLRVRTSQPGRYASMSATFRRVVAALAVPLREAPQRTDGNSSRILAGDARCLPLPDSSIDVVLTSPPYCTRLDYPVSVGFELAALGLDQSTGLRALRLASMGTPLMRSQGAVTCALPSRMRSLLERIGAHPSKDSATYYRSSYEQYFVDAQQCLRELARVLRPRSRAVLVLQTSFYKDIPIPLPDLYLELADAAGLRGATVATFPVQRVLTQINTTSHRHLPTREYAESVIALEAS